jgi:hypothetical protein
METPRSRKSAVGGEKFLGFASAFLLFASFFFIRDFSGPGIMSGF